MKQPQYLEMLRIKCPYCPQYVKADGITIVKHMVLEYKFSPGETICVCWKCWNKMDIRNALLSRRSNWKVIETKVPDPV